MKRIVSLTEEICVRSVKKNYAGRGKHESLGRTLVLYH